MSKIESKIEAVDLQLKTIDGKLKIFGTMNVEFTCLDCNGLCSIPVKYDGNISEDEYNCPHCEKEYLVRNTIFLKPEIDDDAALYKRMKPVIEKIKDGG